MADRQCTRFIDEDGLDIGCALVTKEYMLEAYPDLVPWMKTPGLWAWGLASLGQLGNNRTANIASSPVQTISGGVNWRSASSDGANSAAIKTDGTLWLWGCGGTGQLGDDTVINKSSPVQTISGGTNWFSVSLPYRATIALKTDGSLWLWGCNAQGQLGDDTVINKSSPVQTVSGGTNWRSISGGYSHAAAIKTDGSLWLWGCNAQGRLGDSTAANKSSPVQTVSGGTDWRSVNLGTSHSAAIKTDGTLWLWGSGANGVLGDNTCTTKSSPVQTISGGVNWRSVSGGSVQSGAIKTDGSLWIWGGNSQGSLGDNSIINTSSPIQTISGGTNWRSISLGNSSSAAIKTDGSLWTWGFNSAGRLGDNTNITRSSPVQTFSGGTGWRSVNLGVRTNHMLAIRDEEYY